MPTPDPGQWLAHAERDIAGMMSLLRDENYPLASFLAQQAAETSLKAFLAHATGSVPRVHNLADLLERCLPHDPLFERFREGCESLDQFYTPTRYPDGVPGTRPHGLPGRADG